ncbi:unnamed protein product, partial [Trichobilharzia regenti]
RKTPRRTDYCEVCEQTFQNGRHFYAHLRWKKHKRLCRVSRLLKGQLKKTPDEVAGDPLGAFALYMNTDCSVPYGNYGDCKEVELDAGNAFLQKFLDLKHLISQESNPVGEEFIQEKLLWVWSSGATTIYLGLLCVLIAYATGIKCYCYVCNKM